MKKRLAIILGFFILLGLVGCSNQETIEDGSVDMFVNGKKVKYNHQFIHTIDKSLKIDKKHPPTVKSIKPTEEADYTIEVKFPTYKDVFRLWESEGHFLIDISKGKDKESFWMGFENEEYTKVKQALSPYDEK